MIKLYFAPGACCMSCHIILEETKTPFELVYVGKKADDKTRGEFLVVNPLGAVPAVQLDNGKTLTQNIAILEYLADQHPEYHLLDKPGSFERAEQMRWLSFIASDLHKAFTPLFRLTQITNNTDAQNDIKNWAFSTIEKYLLILESHLKDKTYLSSDRFTVADAYLFTVLQWTIEVDFPIEKFTEINRYSEALSKRASIESVRKREEKFR